MNDIFRKLAIKYGCRYTKNYKTNVVKIDVSKCAKPIKFLKEFRLIQDLIKHY